LCTLKLVSKHNSIVLNASKKVDALSKTKQISNFLLNLKLYQVLKASARSSSNQEKLKFSFKFKTYSSAKNKFKFVFKSRKDQMFLLKFDKVQVHLHIK